MQRFGWGKRVAPAFALFVLTLFKPLVRALLKRVNVFSGCLWIGFQRIGSLKRRKPVFRLPFELG